MPDLEKDDYLWDPSATPDPFVVRFETALRGMRSSAGNAIREFDVTTLPPRDRSFTWRSARWPVAAIAAGLLLVFALGVSRRIVGPWAVVTMRDTPGLIPAVQARPPLTAGDWITTDASTRARLNVGSLGKADIGPSSRVRLIRAALTEHRLELAEGTLHARIWAPPRFFLVETVSALAVDLGCVYTMQIDRLGVGYLRVESGEVELVGQTQRALVPAGNRVHVNREMGPGLPYPDNASPAFIAALRKLEENPADSAQSTALESLLREATSRTTITLWHLLPRVEGQDRAAVTARLAQLAPLPGHISIESVTSLDPRSMKAWQASMETSWSNEKVYFWKRWWRSMWRARSS